MYEIKATGRFKKDLKVMIKRGYNMELLNEIVTMLANGENLPEKTGTIIFQDSIPEKGNVILRQIG